MIPFHVPEYIRTLKPYVPGKPIDEAQREYNLKKAVKLASNENPLGPSPLAMAAARKHLKNLHRYPDSSAFHFKKALSKKLGVPEDWLLLGNGSNEVMTMLVRAYCHPGDQVVTSQSAFVAFRICAQIQGAVTIETPLTSQLGFQTDEMLKHIYDQPQVKMVYIPNPNNPTGAYIPRDELHAFLDKVQKVRDGSVIVMMDYAYWEYVTARDLSTPEELLKKFKNVVVLRTFSKIYGLAGLRMGYAVGRPEILNYGQRVREPFNNNSLALAAAQEALADQAFIRDSIKSNKKSTIFWEKKLPDLGIQFVPSQGNFVLMNVARATGFGGSEFSVRCLPHGLILRPVDNYGLKDWVRMSYGTQDENQFALKVLKKVLKEGVQAGGIS